MWLTVNWLSVKEVTLDHGACTHLIRSLKVERKLNLPGFLLPAAVPSVSQLLLVCGQMADALGLQLCSTAPYTQCRCYLRCLERASLGADLSPAYLLPSLWETGQPQTSGTVSLVVEWDRLRDAGLL